jgi:phosphoserine phosphatase RsbU/P
MSRGDNREVEVFSDASAFDDYLQSIVHAWSKTLTLLGFTLVPLFFVLDTVMLPGPLLPRFGLYRFVCTLVVFGQYVLVRATKPTRYSPLHGYFFSFVVGGMICLMTRDLGGFDSTYYAGLNLVLIAVNLLLPWRVVNSVLNSLLLIAMYALINFTSRQAFAIPNLINNLYFMISTGVIAVSINHVKHNLIRTEFEQRAQLKTARDALFSEMEVAKRIQTALLPDLQTIGGYEIAATMQPAEEVGGDYYDIISTHAGERWLAIGDVSGHGVESGLIMMMTQTSIFTTVNRTAGFKPSGVIDMVNSVMKQNIARLRTDRYMTLSVMHLDQHNLIFAGKHQDVLLRRKRTGQIELIPSSGTWIGVVDDIGEYLSDTTVPVEDGDIVLLFTDGVTEAANRAGEMWGQESLERALDRYAHLPVAEIVASIIVEVRQHMDEQTDDITLLALKRTDPPTPSPADPN